MAASLDSSIIDNISECTNLRNLYSVSCEYLQREINTLTNLLRFSSQGDRYYGNESCMLHDLLMVNKLEYVNIYYGENIVNPMTISRA